jgi:hypothetical protein
MVLELVRVSNARITEPDAASQMPNPSAVGQDAEPAGPKVRALVRVRVWADNANVADCLAYPDPTISTALESPVSSDGIVVNNPTCQAVGRVAEAV